MSEPWRDRVIFADEIERRFSLRPLPCPFCGSPHVGLYLGPTPHITCGACAADGPASEDREIHMQHRQARAIQMWNLRADQAMEAALMALRLENKTLREALAPFAGARPGDFENPRRGRTRRRVK